MNRSAVWLGLLAAGCGATGVQSGDATATGTTSSDGALAGDDGSLDDGGSPGPDGGTPTGDGGVVSAPGGYHVVGNQILDGNNHPHLFHGLARPSLEWSTGGDHLSAADFQAMAGWKANVVRLSLNQDFWLPQAAQHAASYEATVDQAVKWAEAAGLDVILDLHWSDQGNLALAKSAQQPMADANSIAFWKLVAAKYKGDGHVLFELYNEPHDVPWTVWKSGGAVGGVTYAGMQQLYDAIRGAGAENLVVIGGLNWAYDLSGVPGSRVVGHNIVYNTHDYNFAGKMAADWDKGFGFLAATDAVIATEFGTYDCSTTYYTQLLAYFKAHNMSWTAWAWFPGGCGFPSVIADWSGAPNAPGMVVKAALP